jgi:cytochrome c-type biogenesis protein
MTALALWLGILTSISPCPLATNIAAISFIGRQLGDRRAVLLSGVLYTLGRALAYSLLGIGISAGLLASSGVSLFLQRYMNEILGPCLILLGMILLGMIGSGATLNIVDPSRLQEKAEKWGLWMALPLGVLFALSFCPVSAGLFFGALIPLALREGAWAFLPLAYGVGTALPVLLFSLVIAFGGGALGKAFNCLTKLELWMRRIAGTLFIVAGIYYCLRYIYVLPL